MEIWEPKAPGNLWAIPGLLRDSFTYYLVRTESLKTLQVKSYEIALSITSYNSHSIIILIIFLN